MTQDNTMALEDHTEGVGQQRKAQRVVPAKKRGKPYRRTSFVRPGSYYHHQRKGLRRRLSSKSTHASGTTAGEHQQNLFRGDEDKPVASYFLPKHPGTLSVGILPNFLPRSNDRAPPPVPPPSSISTASPTSAVRPRPSRSPTTPQPASPREERTSPPSASPTPPPSLVPTSTPTTEAPTSAPVTTSTPTEVPTSMPVPPTPVVPNDPVVVPPSQTPTTTPTALQVTRSPIHTTRLPTASPSDVVPAPSQSPVNSVVPVATTVRPTSPMAAPHTGMPSEQDSSSPTQTLASQNPSETFVPTWENFTGTNTPTGAPVVESKERTLVPTTMPSPKAHNSIKLQATDFYIRYVISDQTPNSGDYEVASATTLDYLDSFMENAFLRNNRIFFEYGDSEVLGTSSNPIIIAFSYDFFVEASNFQPSPEDIDRLISTALSPPASQALLNSLSALERKNPFSRTEDVFYSLNLTSLVDTSQPASPESNIPAGVIVMLTMGILLGAAGLGMILLRRRRFRRQRVQPGGACSVDGSELLSPNESPTTFSGGSDPGMLSIGSTSLLDLTWSMPGYGNDSSSDSGS